MSEKIFKIMGEVLKLVEKNGHNVWSIFLQGSQNYSLDTEKSDYDFKCFVLPSFDDVYNKNMVSLVYETEYGQVEVKDIRLLNELIKKGNITYIEILYSKYKIIKTNKNIFDIKDNIVEERKKIIFNTAIGMALQKQKDMTKLTERNSKEIEQFGYERKQLHHIARIYFLLKRLVNCDFGTSMDMNYDLDDKEKCLKYKTEPLAKMDVGYIAQNYIDKIRKLEHHYDVEIKNNSLEILEKSIKNIVRKNLMVDIHKGSHLYVYQTHSHYNQLSPKHKQFLNDNFPEINQNHFVDILEYTQFECFNFWEIK